MLRTLLTSNEVTLSDFNKIAETDSIPYKLDLILKTNLEATYPILMNDRGMEKAGIPQGCYILFDPNIQPKNGDIVYVCYNEEHLIRFYNKHGSTITLYGSTADIETIRWDGDGELIILGVVTWSLKCHTL